MKAMNSKLCSYAKHVFMLVDHYIDPNDLTPENAAFQTEIANEAGRGLEALNLLRGRLGLPLITEDKSHG